MDKNLQILLEEIRSLEKSVVDQLKQKGDSILFRIEHRSVTFEQDIVEKQAAFRKSIRRFLREVPWMSYVVAPIIYGMIVPVVFLDVFICFYQATCMPIYGIPKVVRKDYISLDRGKLRYLNWIERFNCNYCGYVNGVFAYVREVASRTEQYFCPIRHALRTKGLHPRFGKFIPFGEAATFQEKLIQLRSDVRNNKSEL